MKKTGVFQVLKETAREWISDKAPNLAASLSFYTLFSVAPLLIIAIAIAGLVFGKEAARGEVVRTLSGLLGPTASAGIESMIRDAASQQKTGIISSVIGIGALLLGASGVFSHLKESLNAIWSVEPEDRGIMGTIRAKFFSFSMVLGVGFLLLVSLIVSTALSAAGRFMSKRIPLGEAVWQAINFAVSLAVIAVLFAAILRFVPDIRIPWRNAWVGGIFTGFLFVIGKFLIGLYLGHSAVASTYGAAASLVILLLWIYYSSLILFFGAEFTEVYGRRREGAGDRPRQPAVTAVSEPAPLPEVVHGRGSRPGKGRGRVVLPVAAGVSGLAFGVVLGVAGVVFKATRGVVRLVATRL